MSKITAVILTKNEENMLVDCLESLNFCEEIIVVDNYSTDRTVELAKQRKARVYITEISDFAERRNIGLQKAKTNWILYVDADERVSEDLQEHILEVVSNKNIQKNGFRLQRKNYYLGNHPWPKIEKLERLFRKKALKGWTGSLHETAEMDGEYGDLKGYLLHYTHRDLSSMLAKTIQWSAVEADLRFKANHPPVVWWRLLRVMVTAFYDSFIKQKGYTVGTVGVIESTYQAFSMFITYARLWELQQK